ncbi:hypothetical protein FJ960_13665 [Mesorhizobium sp. B2-3-11]|uniref:hypothetical protein n=1 Tax=Mesorhizobium sp. B2-3-11 TaxID=2589953 RepID=UPI0011273640|nr:hypothetical protein [Mesorhizobium sp. B2-3-11]TPM05436.1 hypothetical protein FJ960_13665 [Mesorhizobium sp. B2-3-11]
MQRVASIAPLVAQHAGDAAFLWLRRRHEIDMPFLDETDIGRIDQRLEANIEGLMAAGESGWQAARAQFADFAEPGEIFVLGVVALRSGEREAVEIALAAVEEAGGSALACLSGSVARTPRDQLKPFVAEWLVGRDPLRRSLGLAALQHHRIDPGARVAELLANADPEVRRRALRLAGTFKRRDLLAPVIAALDADLARERLAAALAACLLGEARLAHPVLDRITLTQKDLAAPAMELRLLTTPGKAGKEWLQSRLDQPALSITATAAVGLFGDRAVMPWLIERMREPDLAEAAGLALRDLFEVDFNDLALFTSDPALLGPDFTADEPLPIADKVAAWWDEGHGGRGHGTFRSMRRLRLDALRAALAEPDATLADWRRTRRYPAWM